jgi:hypothetical protein
MFCLISDAPPSIILAVVLGVILPAAAIIIVVVFLIIFLKRRPKKPTDVEKKRNSNRVSNAHDMKISRPVRLADFIQHVDRMAKDSNLEFSNEYEVNLMNVYVVKISYVWLCLLFVELNEETDRELTDKKCSKNGRNSFRLHLNDDSW